MVSSPGESCAQPWPLSFFHVPEQEAELITCSSRNKRICKGNVALPGCSAQYWPQHFWSGIKLNSSSSLKAHSLGSSQCLYQLHRKDPIPVKTFATYTYFTNHHRPHGPIRSVVRSTNTKHETPCIITVIQTSSECPVMQLGSHGRCPFQPCQTRALLWYHGSTNLPSIRTSFTTSNCDTTLDADQSWRAIAVCSCEAATPTWKHQRQMNNFCA